ncbi:hypothetical protein F5J12DRAFT_831247 [Pisolithus orientalis]|uniref:uncharacterized protein n=1 Tax=Pisolithus orientalis TaxID=936130 RepID=UPI0022245C05|nr:uncharacterized protein F5J12DRAFT_831247 [Pisolithus orientalis]KAI6006519.1 hypothetical protein F5J12DRAFT_831247 [Pisolithus orientalis]
MTASSRAPPYYVLASHNTLQSTTSAQPSTVLAHVDIHYRHADDSPLSLLPSHPDEHVFVLYHDPDNPTAPTIRSTSSQFSLSGIKDKNPNMYVLQVTSIDADSSHVNLESSQAYPQNPQALVTRFKQRNYAIRNILEYTG